MIGQAEGTQLSEYEKTGIEFDPIKNEIRIDLSEPRGISVKAIDELTGQVKVYMLRVTRSRALVLA